MDRNRIEKFNFAIVFLLLAAPSLLARLYLFYDLGIAITTLDLKTGIASCFGFALGLTVVLSFIKKRAMQWAITLIVAIILTGLSYTNVEMVVELGTPFNMGFLHFMTDKEFVQGSFLLLTRPMLFLGLVFSPLILLLNYKRLFPFKVKLLTALSTGLVSILLCASAHMSFDGETRRWRQFDPTYDILVSIFSASSDKSEAKDNLLKPTADQQVILDRIFKPELDGALLTQHLSPTYADGKLPNVLLIIIESMSGKFMPSLAGPWQELANLMPLFDEYAKKGMRYVNVLNNGKKTDQGEYALLCGDFPNLSIDDRKMDIFAHRPLARPCLAKVLGDLGYQTTYLQSANLTFMSKNLFMPNAGFQEAFGAPYFKNVYQIGGWGVDDRTLFETTYQMIENRKTNPQPWFMTILNVGTHHPGLAPEDWLEKQKWPSRYSAAFAYTDKILTEFLKKIEAAGLMKNTLVIVTGDEARSASLPTETASKLAVHWGHFTVFGPNRAQGINDDLFSQHDLPNSVLDYLHMSERNPGWSGRSLFRKYDQGRILPLGYSAEKQLWLVRENVRVTACNSNSYLCESFIPNQKIVVHNSFRYRLPSPNKDDITILKHVVAMNDVPEKTNELNSTTSIAATDPIQISRSSKVQIVAKHHFGPLEYGNLVRVKMNIRVLSGEIKLRPIYEYQTLADQSFGKAYRFRSKTLKAGEQMLVDLSTLLYKNENARLFQIRAESMTESSEIQFEQANISILKPSIDALYKIFSLNKYRVSNQSLQ